MADTTRDQEQGGHMTPSQRVELRPAAHGNSRAQQRQAPSRQLFGGAHSDRRPNACRIPRCVIATAGHSTTTASEKPIMRRNVGFLSSTSSPAPTCARCRHAEFRSCDVMALITTLREKVAAIPGMVRNVTSYLVSKRVHLTTFGARETNERNTGRSPICRGKRCVRVPVFVPPPTVVLRAEESLQPKNLKRATIVGGDDRAVGPSRERTKDRHPS